MNTKICTKCKTNKALDLFPIRKNSSDGRNSWCNECCRIAWLERKYKYLPKYKETHAKRKKLVIEKYGGVCVCCGETEIAFLTIDHINNDGAEHRRKIGHGGTQIYRWLVKNDFPPGFQTLCFNCNCAKSIIGYCPHEEGRSIRH